MGFITAELAEAKRAARVMTALLGRAPHWREYLLDHHFTSINDKKQHDTLQVLV